MVIQSISICLLAFIAGCGPVMTASIDEVNRVTSPTGAVDAVLHETNGGATTSFGYIVSIVAAGNDVSVDPAEPGEQEIARLYGAVRNESAYGVNLAWGDNSHIVIEYLDAQSAELVRESVMIDGIPYSAELRPGTEDLEAPAGGMLYNKTQRP